MRLEGLISFQNERYVLLDREHERVYVLQLGDDFEVMLCGQWQAVTLKSGGYRGLYIETGSGQRERLVLCMQARLDRVSQEDTDSITSDLYVQPAGCLRRSGLCIPSALQAALRPYPTMGERGGCSSGRYDCRSGQETRQNGFVARDRGILCLADCYVWFRPISIGDTCAYARHTPHAHATHTNTLRGGVPGCWCCTWFSVNRVPATHPFLSKGGGVDLVGVNALVIGRTAWVSDTPIRSKRGWVVGCCVWCVGHQGRDTGKPRPSKYISGCFLLFLLPFQVVQTRCLCTLTNKCGQRYAQTGCINLLICINVLFLDWRARV